MRLHPTRTTVDVAFAGMAMVVVGLLAREAAIVGWGGALLVGLGLARAVTRVGVARIRSAGFEMLWQGEERVVRVARGATVEIDAEIRNRDTLAARYVALRVVASPELEVELTPEAGEVAASGRLRVTVTVRADRVGRFAVHGLSLEVQGAPGLFEVPLTFANPFGVEVLPRPFAITRRSAAGGRSRRVAEVGRPGRLPGEGDQLRELRELVPGDPFKRIAWRASARRGKLMVREFEREERDRVWLVLDMSVELWAGAPGTAPLDRAIDELTTVALRHLGRGDRVGLALVAARTLAWVPPEGGAAHGQRLMSVLAAHAHTVDQDRSDLDETEVAARVLEHLRPLMPDAVRGVSLADLDRVARRVDRAVPRAPFPRTLPHAGTPRERVLRSYLTAFGVGSPPRQEPERAATDANLAECLSRLTQERGASLVYLWSPPFDASRDALGRALAHARQRRLGVRWVPMTGPVEPDPARGAVAEAVALRVRLAEQRGARALRALGVRHEVLRRPPPVEVPR